MGSDVSIFCKYFGCIPECLLLVDKQKKIIASNDLLLDLVGYQEKELKGKPLNQLMSFKQRNKFIAILDNFLKDLNGDKSCFLPNYIKLKNRIVHQSGKTFPVEFSLSSILLDNELYVLISFTNISERVRVKKNYKEVSEKLQVALDSSIIGIWEYDFLTQNFTCDENMMKLYKLNHDDKGISLEIFKKCIHQKDIERVDKSFEYAIKHGETFDETFRIFWPDGSMHYIKTRGKVIYNKSGKALHMLGTNWDVTAERENELDLKRSYEMNRAFIEQAPSAIAMLDNDMRYLAVSKKWITDYNLKGDIIGKSHYEVFPEIPAEWKEHHQKCLNGGEDVSDETAFEREDGTIQWISWEVKPWYVDEGEIGGLLMYTINLTSFKENYQENLRLQNMLHKINEVAGIGIWEVDLEKNTVYWSSITKEIHEAPEDYVVDLQQGISFYIPEDRLKIINLIEQMLSNGEPFDDEFQIMTLKDNLRWVRSIGLIETIEGKNKRLYGLFQDISNSKNHEKTLVQARLKAEAASKSKSDFLANMSHEIRTPLNGVIGFTDLLMKTSLTNNQMGYLKTVNSSANLLLDVINDILDFSKIEAGKLELNLSPVDIYDLCKEAVDIIKFQAEKKKIEVLLNIDTNIHQLMSVDDIRLKQIITNLLNNAVKFTEKGEIELKIKVLEHLEKEKAVLLRFSIRDTGKGIAKSQLSKIFNAFDQEDNSITRKYGGTGLGLTISNRLLKLMGAELKVRSELNIGSVFYFDVKFNLIAANEIDTPKKSIYKKVLLVDDNDQNLEILEGMLQQLQIECKREPNGVEAIQTLMQTKDFDLIISDYNMPFMSGVEFLTYVRNNFKEELENVDMMLLHSIAEDQVIIKARKELNITKCFEKPISFKDLAKFIQPTEKVVNDFQEESFKIDSQIKLPKDLEVLIVEDNPVNTLLITEVISQILPTAHLSFAKNGKIAIEKCNKSFFNLIFMDVQMPVMSGLEATRAIRTLEDFQHTIIFALTARILAEERKECIDSGMNAVLTKPLKFNEIKKMIAKFNYNTI
ncbi:response regulator [Mesonia aestuariivivens]|uniref:histidine kinase n=1 Tax=Mesonia aestuariivivens TaxID=2796128 RepID=A0ABS6VY51_9FLAO|nr:response regulator [Mesonia aestuariivivens]MBW2960501.1 response regulator [Mesonia aestuariivivens]